DVLPVVARLVDEQGVVGLVGRQRVDRGGGRQRRRQGVGLLLRAALARRARRRVRLRQVEGEDAARAGRADEADLAAEQLGELARDGQAEARAGVLARSRTIGLLERLEDDLLLVASDADAG